MKTAAIKKKTKKPETFIICMSCLLKEFGMFWPCWYL